MKKQVAVGIFFGLATVIAFIVWSVFNDRQSSVNFPTKTTAEPTSYISCGCGCCGSDMSLEEIAQEVCLDKSKGERIQDKINKDRQLSLESCATVGCSAPIKYTYCN